MEIGGANSPLLIETLALEMATDTTHQGGGHLLSQSDTRKHDPVDHVVASDHSLQVNVLHVSTSPILASLSVTNSAQISVVVGNE